MPNMSYCRFENTLADLRDCEENMDVDPEELDDTERKARIKLLKMCARIAKDWARELEELEAAKNK